MRGDVSFALIVGTRNRPRELRRLLASIAVQTHRAVHVYVVDQSDAQNIVDNESSIASVGNDIAIDHIVVARTGLSAARNVALRKVTEHVVGFPDDDCWYAPDLLQRVLDELADPKIGFACGTYGEPDTSLAQSANKELFSPLMAMRKSNSVSLFFKSELLRSFELAFDERIGAGTSLPAGEETDLVLRALQQGIAGVWSPSLMVYHPVERAGNIREEQIVARTRAFAYTLTRNALRGQSSLVMAGSRFLMRSALLAAFSARTRGRMLAFLDGVHLAITEYKHA